MLFPGTTAAVWRLPAGQRALPIMAALTHRADGSVFAEPRRTNVNLMYANMHASRFILIIKMRQLCVQQIVLLVNQRRSTPPL